MEYSAEIYIARKDINNMMESFDMKPDHKCYVIGTSTMKFTAENGVTEETFYKLIEKSKESEDFWIPAVLFCDNLYVSPEIKELSDGEKILSVNK